MNDEMKIDLPDGCKLIDIPHASDERGELSFAEAESVIPFGIRRVFWIYNIPENAIRGGHAHWQTSEVVIAVQGAFTMRVDDGNMQTDVRLTSPTQGILIPPGIWCELRDFENGTVLVVMASHPYEAKGYVHNYEEYKKRRKNA